MRTRRWLCDVILTRIPIIHRRSPCSNRSVTGKSYISEERPTDGINTSQIHEAYETLVDVNRRVIYDAKLRSQRGTSRFSRAPRNQWDIFDGGADVPSWPPPRDPFSGFRKQQPNYSSYHYWHAFGGSNSRRPPIPDPRPSWDNNTTSKPQTTTSNEGPSWGENVPRPETPTPNEGASWEKFEDKWGSYAPPSPDWDKKWAKDQREREERLKKEREEEQSRKQQAEKERRKREWPSRQKKLLTQIVALDLEIAKLEMRLAKSNRTGPLSDVYIEDDENGTYHTIFDIEIMLNSRRKKLQTSVLDHVYICKQQRKYGWDEQAEMAEKNLAEARAKVRADKEEPKYGHQNLTEARAKVMDETASQEFGNQRQDVDNTGKKDPDERDMHRKSVREELYKLRELHRKTQAAAKEHGQEPKKNRMDGLETAQGVDLDEQGPRTKSQEGRKARMRTTNRSKETGAQMHLREWLANLTADFPEPQSDPNTFEPTAPPPDSPSTTINTEPEPEPEPLVPDLKQSAPTSVSSTTRNETAENHHVYHMEVHRGFWEFASGEKSCFVCYEEGTMLQCPMCDKVFCGACKDSYCGEGRGEGLHTWRGK